MIWHLRFRGRLIASGSITQLLAYAAEQGFGREARIGWWQS